MNEEEIKKELYEQYPIDNELSFNEFTIEDSIQNQLKLELKYWDLLQNETYKMNKLDDIMIDYRFKAYDKLRFENDRTLTKYEIEEVYLPKEKSIKAIKAKIIEQNVRIDFFKMCYDSVKQLRWNIQTFLKAQGQQ